MERSPVIQFVIYGKPQPQGSMRAPFKDKKSGRLIVTSDNENLHAWRQDAAVTAMLECRRLGLRAPVFPHHTPVAVRFRFFLARPKSAPKRRWAPTTKPDFDKLVRATCDAMTGTVLEDDSDVVLATVSKHYGSPPRAEVFFWQPTPQELEPGPIEPWETIPLAAGAAITTAGRAGQEVPQR